jgi:hypothetical protein
MMRHVYNDGGREAAGYKGKVGDCVARAIAIANEKPYQEVYKGLQKLTDWASQMGTVHGSQ